MDADNLLEYIPLVVAVPEVAEAVVHLALVLEQIQVLKWRLYM